MNTVLSSYGQLCGCPEILKKSCKFFCRGLDIRVPQIVDSYNWQPHFGGDPLYLFIQGRFCEIEYPVPLFNPIELCHVFLNIIV